MLYRSNDLAFRPQIAKFVLRQDGVDFPHEFPANRGSCCFLVMQPWSCLIAAYILQLSLAHASEGDAAWQYHVCIWRCNQTGCTDVPGRTPICKTACPYLNQLPVPLTLRLTGWSCEDDCK